MTRLFLAFGLSIFALSTLAQSSPHGTGQVEVVAYLTHGQIIQVEVPISPSTGSGYGHEVNKAIASGVDKLEATCKKIDNNFGLMKADDSGQGWAIVKAVCTMKGT